MKKVSDINTLIQSSKFWYFSNANNMSIVAIEKARFPTHISAIAQARRELLNQ